MEKKTKSFRLAGIPAWALSLMALAILFIPLFILDNTRSSSIQTGGYILCIMITSLASFMICRIHPKSVFYTPLIVNALAVIAIIVYVFTNLSDDITEVIFWAISMVLSFIGAIIGAGIGRKRTH